MAAPGGLQRSMMTFRRSGSSGLVWEDRLLSESSSVMTGARSGKDSELRHCRSVGVMRQTCRSRSHAHHSESKRFSPVLDPPSPKVSGCGFFGIFRNTGASQRPKLRRR